MSLKKILSAETMMLYLLILMLILLIIFSGRQLSSLGDGREMLKLEEEALAADQARLLFLERLAAEKPQLRLDLEIAHRLIPQKASAHELFVYLHEIAYLSGMQDLQVDFADAVQHAEHVELPLSLSLTGTYHAILQLLQALREGERAFRLDSLQIDAAADRALVELELNMSAFYRN